MSLKLLHSIDLPGHVAQGGFDHAAIHRTTSRLFVAHTINNAIDVIDCESDRYLYSIPDLTGVAGALVSDERDMIFTSNRGENTISVLSPTDKTASVKIGVGIRPNGLAFDPQRGLLLAANVGNPDRPDSFTLSIVDIEQQKMVASIPVEDRTRWTIFDPASECFYVNISEPAQIVVVESANPTCVAWTIAIPAKGAHGLDLDPTTGHLFCACDAGKLFVLNARSGKILLEADLTGKPDVIFFNPSLKHLYVAIGDPGVIDVFDTETLHRLEVVSTEKGAHTIAFDAIRNKVYAFLPQTHRAQVFADE